LARNLAPEFENNIFNSESESENSSENVEKPTKTIHENRNVTERKISQKLTKTRLTLID